MVSSCCGGRAHVFPVLPAVKPLLVLPAVNPGRVAVAPTALFFATKGFGFALLELLDVVAPACGVGCVAALNEAYRLLSGDIRATLLPVGEMALPFLPPAGELPVRPSCGRTGSTGSCTPPETGRSSPNRSLSP